MRLTFGLILAIIIGLSLGLIGGGGSILAVPILRYVMGVEPRSAIAMSLFIVGVVSLIGIIPHWRQGNVNLPVAISFIPPAMVGAFIGAKITQLPFITDTIQLVAFGIVMLLASLFMIKKSSGKPSETEVTSVKVQPVGNDKTKKDSFNHCGRVSGRYPNRFCGGWGWIFDYSSPCVNWWYPHERSCRHLIINYCH